MLVELESTAQSFELFLGQFFMAPLAALSLLVGSFFRHRHCHELPSDSSFVWWRESVIARILAPAPRVDRLSGPSKNTSIGCVLAQSGLHVNCVVLANRLMALAIRAKLTSISSFQFRLRQFLHGCCCKLIKIDSQIIVLADCGYRLKIAC